MNLNQKKAAFCSINCKAWCCRFIICDFQPFKGLENDNLFLSLRNMKITPDNKLIIPNRCNWLDNHNKCKIYTCRPKSCVTYECEDLKRIH